MIEKVTHKLDFGKSYYVTSDNEFICDTIITSNEFMSKEYIIINSLSKKRDVSLLPKYRDSHKKDLKKEGLSPNIGVVDLKFLKFIIDNEIEKNEIIFFGLNGLHFEGVSFLKEYANSITERMRITFVLIDFSSNYETTTISLI